DRHLRRYAHVVADVDGSPGIQAAVPVDPAVGTDTDAGPTHLVWAVEPHVAAQMDTGMIPNVDPKTPPVPGVAQPVARHPVDDVVGEVVENPYRERVDPGSRILRCGDTRE